MNLALIDILRTGRTGCLLLPARLADARVREIVRRVRDRHALTVCAQLSVRRLATRAVVGVRERGAMGTLKSVPTDAVIVTRRVDTLGVVLASKCGARVQFT